MELHELIKNLYGVDKLEGYSDEDIAFLKEMFGDMPEVLEDYYRKAGRTGSTCRTNGFCPNITKNGNG